jgi:curved DNA-binding protein CbpA
VFFADKGGDPELFKEMSEAYAILSDEEKRAKYDKYGHDAPDDGTLYFSSPVERTAVNL